MKKLLNIPCPAFIGNTHIHTGTSALCILIFSAVTFFTNHSFSQISLSNNNTIWKTQGNAADTNAFMGTTNSTGLRFKTRDGILHRKKIEVL